MKRQLSILCILAVALSMACHTHRGAATRPLIDPELANLSKEEVFQRGETAFDSKKYQKSRRYYTFVYENYPNDPLGRRSLLRIADTFFKEGGPVNLVESQYKYRDFINRFPGSEYADYAMLQIANVSFAQMERPDRDQTKTKEAVTKFQEMIAAYPKSQYRADADTRLSKAQDRLAEHEHIIAHFYMKRRNFEPAVTRLNGIVDNYPAYSDRDQVFFDLGTALAALGRSGEARLYFERVVAEFPKSDFAGKAREKLQDNKA
ncbi:MAG: outer membrane protein assembly factor BamD [Acidobacteriota bacterium]